MLAQKISFHLFVCSRSDKPIPSLAHLFSSLCIVLEILILSNFCNQSFWSFSRSISKPAAITGVKASKSLQGRLQFITLPGIASPLLPLRAAAYTAAEQKCPPPLQSQSHPVSAANWTPCTHPGIPINLPIRLRSKPRHTGWLADHLPAIATTLFSPRPKS